MTPEFKKYYDAELRYLKESGGEFAEAHPDIAGFLMEQQDSDPYAERLLEGFATLTARIQEDLGSGFEELASMFQDDLAPIQNYCVPSITLIAATSKTGKVSTLPAGTIVRNTVSHFEPRTIHVSLTHDLVVAPLTIDKVKNDDSGKVMTLAITVDERLNAKLPPFFDCYISGDREVAWALIYALRNDLTSVTLSAGNQTIGSKIEFPQFESEESLLPLEYGELPEAHHLRDFFLYKEKYRIIRIALLNSVPDDDLFEIRFDFKNSLPETVRWSLSPSLFVPNVVPAVNLFYERTEPVTISQKKHEYLVKPMNGIDCTIRRVIQVTALGKNDQHSFGVYPYETYESAYEENPFFYTIQDRVNVKGGLIKYISFYSPSAEIPEETTLSIEAEMTHGERARNEIKQGDLVNIADEFSESVFITNITKPSQYIEPRPKDEALWRVLGALSSRLTTYASTNALKEILHHFATGAHPSSKTFIDTIIDVSAKQIGKPLSGTLFPSVEFTVTYKDQRIYESSKDTLGMFSTFGEVLHRYLKTQVAMNTLIDLVFVINPAVIEMRWDDDILEE
jgi:type VI secretion system protein ImpG